MVHYKQRSQRWMWGLSGAGLVGWLALATGARAQNAIVPDGTLGAEGSVVVPYDAFIDLIEGGATRGQNLFHSFESFNVGAVNGAYFVVNSADIGNIFARITGANPSNIFGVLGTTQDTGTGYVTTPANLYLINPNGIVFGPGAVLDLGGSFTATTASGVLFGEAGAFSAVDPQVPSGLLTVDPSAYFFSQLGAGEISLTSGLLRSAELQVPDGENLTLLGGDIVIDGGGVIADGGRIEVGAVAGSGVVSLNADGSLSFPEALERADVTITNQAGVGSIAPDGGALTITADDVAVLNSSFVAIGVAGEIGQPPGQAGDLTISAAGDLLVDDQSLITNQVVSGGAGNAGDLQITVTNLEVTNGAQLSASTFGEGDAGDVVIEVTDTARFDGVNPFDSSSPSSARSAVEPGGLGNGGNLQITATNLEVTNGAQLSASTFGQGDGGDVVIAVADTAHFDGVNPFDGSSPSSARSAVEPSGFGNGGNLQITATDLEVTNGAQLTAATFGLGDGGNIILEIAEKAIFDGFNLLANTPSGVLSNASTTAEGGGGTIQISTTSLELINGAVISAASESTGNAGTIFLQVGKDFYANNGTLSTSASFTSGGQIYISASSALFEGDSDISTFVLAGEGSGGDIQLIAQSFIVALDDSDFLAFAADGKGGSVVLQSPLFFGESFIAPIIQATEPLALDGNDRVDISASGRVTGININLVENKLATISVANFTTDQLLSGSCIARADKDQGSFMVTGGGGLPARPGDGSISSYPTGQVQATTDAEDQAVWHPGDPIAEPAGVFQLADGRLVLSQDCE